MALRLSNEAMLSHLLLALWNEHTARTGHNPLNFRDFRAFERHCSTCGYLSEAAAELELRQYEPDARKDGANE